MELVPRIVCASQHILSLLTVSVDTYSALNLLLRMK